MKIFKIKVENYRLLKDFTIDLQEDLSLVIGKNNTGKTSLLSVLDKFLNEKSKFSYDDFNIEFKDELQSMINDNEIPENFNTKGIKLKLFIKYDEYDDLSSVSKVLMDLDPDNNNIVLGFEFIIDHESAVNLKKDYLNYKKNEQKKSADSLISRDIKEFIKRNINSYFRIHKFSYEYDAINNVENESNYIDLVKENINIRNIINFRYIDAKRSVTNQEKGSTLSRQTSSLYKQRADNDIGLKETEEFIEQLADTDTKLSSIYKDIFSDVVQNVQDFGGIKPNDTTIEIISTLQHRDLLDGNTTVVYNQDTHQLPEHYNGLGYMNLISMIFEIEILLQDFKRNKDSKPADINLLIIEEPEAHTHPQMQYIFIKNIKNLLSKSIKREDSLKITLQSIITTHSSHIVADSDFEDIKYLKSIDKNNVTAKNLSDLKEEYGANTKEYDFLKQYLTISRAEIFFADKAVLIEGDTERLLIPTIMRKIDLEEKKRLEKSKENDSFLPLLSQNISIIEVGAYSQIFEKFIEFLGIKTLLITDIDSVENTGKACPVDEGVGTSNSALKHFLVNPDWESLKVFTIEQRIYNSNGSLICICYQQEECGYHARSFEDSFIHINREFIKENIEKFNGIKNAKYFEDNNYNAFYLADNCINKKTHFALDIIFNSERDFSNWQIPEYIREGLLWLKED